MFGVASRLCVAPPVLGIFLVGVPAFTVQIRSRQAKCGVKEDVGPLRLG